MASILTFVLQAALAIKDEAARAQALNGLVPQLEKTEQMKRVEQAILDLAADSLESHRSIVLDILSLPNLVTPYMLGLSQADFARIADSVIQITTQWRWL